MINQFVVEGKCVFQPFTDIDGCGKLYSQINLESNHNLVCARAYNTKVIHGLMNDVHINDCVMITGFVGSVSEAGVLIMILQITQFTMI